MGRVGVRHERVPLCILQFAFLPIFLSVCLYVRCLFFCFLVLSLSRCFSVSLPVCPCLFLSSCLSLSVLMLSLSVYLLASCLCISISLSQVLSVDTSLLACSSDCWSPSCILSQSLSSLALSSLPPCVWLHLILPLDWSISGFACLPSILSLSVSYQ